MTENIKGESSSTENCIALMRTGLNKTENEQNLSTCVEGDSTPGTEHRKRRAVRRAKEERCPLCSVTLRPGEFELHLLQEKERLLKSSRNRPSRQGASTSNGVSGLQRDPQYGEYSRVQLNRRTRIESKKVDIGYTDDVVCPVCNVILQVSSSAELKDHVEKCAQKTSSDEEEIDVEVDGYEWCGQKRVRVTSLLRSQGQLEALGTVMQRGDESEDVDVCEEDRGQFGSCQYSQCDLDALPDPSRSPSSGQHPEGEEESDRSARTSPSVRPADEWCAQVAPPSAVVDALQDRIRELEALAEEPKAICRICHGSYETPLVSVVCWHVHCERCWLLTLKSQKLCPQCKVIVTPENLRRIYL